jgi:hypothetical protein
MPCLNNISNTFQKLMIKPKKQTAAKPAVEEGSEAFVTVTDGRNDTRLTIRFGGVAAIGGTRDGTAVIHLLGGERIMASESEADIRAALGWPEKETEAPAE